MKKRIINENESYIRDAIIKKYKLSHKYEVKTLLFFLFSCIFAIFLGVNIVIALFTFVSKKVLIARIVFLIFILIYIYISGYIFIRNRKDVLKNDSKKYKENSIFVYETKLIDFELSNTQNDLGKVLNEENEEVYGILFGLESIKKNKDKCYLVNDPVYPNINYIFPIVSKDDEDEK